MRRRDGWRERLRYRARVSKNRDGEKKQSERRKDRVWERDMKVRGGKK